MSFQSRVGKIKLLRVNDLGNVYGAPNDCLNTEVVVVLDSAPDMAFGFELRTGDPNLPARLGMLGMLRDGLFHDHQIGLSFDIVEGKKMGHLRRVQFG